MFQAAPYGQSLRFNIESGLRKVTIDITGAVTGCQYHGTHKDVLLSGMSGVYAYHAVSLQYETGHQGFKINLAAAVYNGVADVLNHTRQAVRAYVGVCIGQYCGACAVLAEYVQDAVCAAAFLTTGIKLAIRICSGTALAKAVV